jgi:hypothetical protein
LLTAKFSAKELSFDQGFYFRSHPLVFHLRIGLYPSLSKLWHLLHPKAPRKLPMDCFCSVLWVSWLMFFLLLCWVWWSCLCWYLTDWFCSKVKANPYICFWICPAFLE